MVKGVDQELEELLVDDLDKKKLSPDTIEEIRKNLMAQFRLKYGETERYKSKLIKSESEVPEKEEWVKFLDGTELYHKLNYSPALYGAYGARFGKALGILLGILRYIPIIVLDRPLKYRNSILELAGTPFYGIAFQYVRIWDEAIKQNMQHLDARQKGNINRFLSGLPTP